MLRAGPFSDERVIGLVNRRFVPFFFDLSDAGAAGDPAARKFVVAMRRDLGGSAVATPPVLIATADGKVLAEIDNFASEDAVLSALHEVLERNPDYAAPAPAERDETEPMARARIALELGDHARVRDVLAGRDDDAARSLRAHAARLAGDLDAMAADLDAIADPALSLDARIERAHAARARRDDEAVAKLVADFPRDHARSTEARYLAGLARFHLGDVDGARAVWKELVRQAAQDRWVYRADWAYAVAGQKRGATSFSSAGSKTLLGRIGYLGRPHPDLQR